MPSSVGVDGGESLQAAGDVRGKRRLADVLQALQLTNQNPAGKKKRGDLIRRYSEVDANQVAFHIGVFFHRFLEHHVAVRINKSNLGKAWNPLWSTLCE